MKRPKTSCAHCGYAPDQRATLLRRIRVLTRRVDVVNRATRYHRERATLLRRIRVLTRRVDVLNRAAAR